MVATKETQAVKNKKIVTLHIEDAAKGSAPAPPGIGRAILLICLLSVLAYANSLGGEFVFDDTEQIVENQDIRSWDNIAKAFTTHVWEFRSQPGRLNVPPPLPYYRPLFTIMLTGEFHLFGLWPQGWHLVSLLLHILCSIGVFYVILLASARRLIALFASLLFAVHPAHAESVSWISGMTDPLFGAFFLASFYFFLKARSASGERTKQRAFVWSLVLFAFSAFAKETALSLVLLVFGFDLIGSTAKGSERFVKAFKAALPYVAVALVYLVPRYIALGELMWKNPQAPDRPLAYTLLTLPLVVCTYIFHLLWPVGLSVTYNMHFITSKASTGFLLPAVALALIGTALFIYRKGISREVWQALLLIVVPLVPVLNLGQVSREEYLVFDHYLYLSVAGLGYLVALGTAKLGALESTGDQTTIAGIRRTALAMGAFAVIAAAATAGAAGENRSWADSYSLWSNAARVRPAYWAAHYNVGLALLDAKRFEEARAWLVRATALKPDEADVADALGRAYDGLGDTPGAIASFKRSIEINPEMFESYNNLGTVYFKANEYTLAEANFAAAVRLRPDASASRYNLGLCYSREGRYRDGIREFERVVLLTPEDAEAFYELSVAYENTGRLNDAVRALRLGQGVAKSRELTGKMSESLSRLQGENGHQ
jgi:Flp pilus assembly protein TadD